MPAFRSRTLHWRRNLDQLARRGGTLEVALAPAGLATDTQESGSVVGADFIWKLRIHRLCEEWIELEAPELLQRIVPTPAGVEVAGAIVVGPNRWLFRTECLGSGGMTAVHGRPAATIRLRMPTEVERTRRSHLRVEAISLQLPKVRIWPLLDRESIRPVQRSLALAVEQLDAGKRLESRDWEAESLRPQLGPEFSATLMNLGGGGVGLRVEPECGSLLSNHGRFWIEIDLRPESPLPLGVTVRVAHQHLEAAGTVYAGCAFDFTADADHAKLVARQVLGAVAARQVRQRRGEEPQRRAA